MKPLLITQVVEAVYENTALKQDMFAKLDRICQPRAVLCSNTSRISIDKVSIPCLRSENYFEGNFIHITVLYNSA